MSLRSWTFPLLDPASSSALLRVAFFVGFGGFIMSGVAWISGRREPLSWGLGAAIASIGLALAGCVLTLHFISSRQARDSSNTKAI